MSQADSCKPPCQNTDRLLAGAVPIIGLQEQFMPSGQHRRVDTEVRSMTVCYLQPGSNYSTRRTVKPEAKDEDVLPHRSVHGNRTVASERETVERSAIARAAVCQRREIAVL